MTPSRRAFLLSAAATAACRPAPAAPAAPAAPTAAPPPPLPAAPAGAITAETVAAAEKLAGVQYTAAERGQVLLAMEEHLRRAIERRKTPIDDTVAPATVFDPRLPGTTAPAGKDRIRVLPTAAAPPTRDEDLAHAPVTALAHWIRTRKITSRHLTELYLERLLRLGPGLECVVTPLPDRALAQADRADHELARGRGRGPLHGIPWGAKDLFDTAGRPTTWGAEPFATRMPTHDAFVIRKLDRAGAVLLAKLTLGALAYGDVWHGGVTRNPWNPREGSSGSSAGSAAATAAGLVGFSLGTETLGSIVSPSMRCGTTGLRPTFGRVARTGAMALCWSMDKVGPIARTVEDCMLVLAAIHGTDPGDPSSIAARLAFDATAPIGRPRVGYVPAQFAGEEANEIDRAALAALRDLGAELVEIDLPARPWGALLTILFAESAAAFEPITLDGRDDALTRQDPEAWPNTFRTARFVSAIDLVQADRVRRQAMEAMHELMGRIDVIAAPSYAGSWLLVTNCTGHPSLTLRAGFVTRKPRTTPAGEEDPAGAPFSAPHGFTLIGRLFDEGTLARVGLELERKLAVRDRRPPGFG